MTADAVLLAALALLAGGFVKGFFGIGLPMVALPILLFRFNVPEAIGLMMLPILASNSWQAISYGLPTQSIRRFWPLMLALAATLAPATALLAALDDRILQMYAGSAMVVSGLALTLARDFVLPARLERPVSVFVGLAAGLLGGVSSLFGAPITIFLASLNLDRTTFLASVSVIYLAAGLLQLGMLFVFGVIVPEYLAASALGIVPAVAGVGLAVRLSRNVREDRFRRMLLIFIAFVGVTMIVRSQFGLT